jgi:hypothetical protein
MKFPPFFFPKVAKATDRVLALLPRCEEEAVTPGIEAMIPLIEQWTLTQAWSFGRELNRRDAEVLYRALIVQTEITLLQRLVVMMAPHDEGWLDQAFRQFIFHLPALTDLDPLLRFWAQHDFPPLQSPHQTLVTWLKQFYQDAAGLFREWEGLALPWQAILHQRPAAARALTPFEGALVERAIDLQQNALLKILPRELVLQYFHAFCARRQADRCRSFFHGVDASLWPEDVLYEVIHLWGHPDPQNQAFFQEWQRSCLGEFRERVYRRPLMNTGLSLQQKNFWQSKLRFCRQMMVGGGDVFFLMGPYHLTTNRLGTRIRYQPNREDPGLFFPDEAVPGRLGFGGSHWEQSLEEWFHRNATERF